MKGFICSSRMYEFNGWLFEVHSYCGPWPLKKDWSPRKRAGRVFYKMFYEFDKLSSTEKEKYRSGGGCIPIG